MESYRTIKASGQSLFKDRSSKFYGYTFRVTNEDVIKDHISELWKEHKKARHVCYAFRIGTEKIIYRSNDDGEPSGSAGLPIYNQILSHQLENSLVAVVRYFGGTKLGVPGLINAYKEAANVAIANSKVGVEDVMISGSITFEYSIMPMLMNALKRNKISIDAQLFDAAPSLQFSISKKNFEPAILGLTNALNNLNVKNLDEVIFTSELYSIKLDQ